MLIALFKKAIIMTNVYLKEGMTIGAALSETVNFLNDTGSLINSGQPVKIGNQQMGIALVDIGVGNNGNVARHGIFRVPKNTNQVLTQGQRVFWNYSSQVIDNAPSSSSWFAGYANQAALLSDAYIDVDLAEFNENQYGYGWADITGDINIKGTGANSPSWALFVSGIYAYEFSASVMKECWIVFHVPHSYAPGSDLYLHTHWSTTGTNTGVCRWGFEYSYAKGYNQGAESVFPSSQTVYIEQAGSGVARRHMIAETLPISMPGLEVDSLILVRVFRDAAHANDTQTSAAFLFTSDIHFLADKVVTPNRNPDFYA